MATQASLVRVLLGDARSLFREAVKTGLESAPDLRVVATASDGEEAIAEAARTRPDVALLHADLPGYDAVRGASLIRDRAPECQVVILADAAEGVRILDALEAGVSGYLTKDCPLAELVEAIRTVHRGGTLVPRQMLGPLLDRLLGERREQDLALDRVSCLTRREKEVLALLAEGADTNAIAQTLVISPLTARTHVRNLLAKLGVHSRLEAAAFVTRNGILPKGMGAYA